MWFWISLFPFYSPVLPLFCSPSLLFPSPFSSVLQLSLLAFFYFSFFYSLFFAFFRYSPSVFPFFLCFFRLPFSSVLQLSLLAFFYSLFLFPLFRFFCYSPSVFPFFLSFFLSLLFPSPFSSVLQLSLLAFFYSLFFAFFRYSPSVFPFFLSFFPCFFRFPFFFRPSTFPLMNRQPFGKRRKPFLKLQADFVR